MSNYNYGNKLNPQKSLRIPRSVKGEHQSICVIHNPCPIDENQLTFVKFPNLGRDDVIISGSVNLSFDITLASDVDKKRTLVNNISRSIIKNMSKKFEGNDVMAIDDYDIYSCYKDMWLTKQQKANLVRQGIISSESMADNCPNLRIEASDKSIMQYSILIRINLLSH